MEVLNCIPRNTPIQIVPADYVDGKGNGFAIAREVEGSNQLFEYLARSVEGRLYWSWVRQEWFKTHEAAMQGVGEYCASLLCKT